MATKDANYPLRGRCDCGDLVYVMEIPPIVVQCCHCKFCQRQTGTAFALHAMIETDKLKMLSGEVESMTVASSSGVGQTITRCSKCRCAVWSVYLVAGPGADSLLYLDVGTLDNPECCPPTYHVYTRFKQPWITLSDAVPVFEELYDRTKYWSKEQLERRTKALENGQNTLS